MYKLIILLPIIFSTISFSQEKKLKHSFESTILLTWKPTNKINRFQSKNNPGLELWASKYKKYSLPGLSFVYNMAKKINETTSIGLKTGVNIRYLEKLNNGNQTYYSFPLELLFNQSLFQTKKKIISVRIRSGYNFKHPKYKLYDGLGGFTTGLELIKRNKKASNYFKLGYTLFQERNKIRWNYSAIDPSLKDETWKFNQYLHQLNFGFGLFLN